MKLQLPSFNTAGLPARFRLFGLQTFTAAMLCIVGLLTSTNSATAGALDGVSSFDITDYTCDRYTLLANGKYRWEQGTYGADGFIPITSTTFDVDLGYQFDTLDEITAVTGRPIGKLSLWTTFKNQEKDYAQFGRTLLGNYQRSEKVHYMAGVPYIILKWLPGGNGTVFDASQPAVAFTANPISQASSLGANIVLSVAATGATQYQWMFNGIALAGRTSSALTLNGFRTENAGLYEATATTGTGSCTSAMAIIGATTTDKFAGAGEIVGTDVKHPNGKIFDQVLLKGKSESITADAGQVTRTSFVDLNNDIVQVEFSGPGTLTLVLDSESGPAAPINYNQPTVGYMKGHARIVITGATENTNVSAFAVGRATANDPTGAYFITKAISGTNDPAKNGSPLFVGHSTTSYDGVADIAYIAIQSADGKFGGVRTANASYFASNGITGIYAPGVAFTGPIFVGDMSAFDSAVPQIIVGSVSDCRVTGGNMEQANGAAVNVKGIGSLKFTPGSDAGGKSLPAQPNKGVFKQDGTDVTASIVTM